MLAQLSALHQFRTHVDIAVVVVVLALTNLIAHFTTPWASIATVPVAAVGLVAWLRGQRPGLGGTRPGPRALEVRAPAMPLAAVAVGGWR